jgi:hypothetical protein
MEWEGSSTAGALYWRFRELLQQQGHSHLLVAAAGNQGRPLLGHDRCRPFFFLPAQMRAANMLVVGASGEGAQRCWHVRLAVAGLVNERQARAKAWPALAAVELIRTPCPPFLPGCPCEQTRPTACGAWA